MSTLVLLHGFLGSPGSFADVLARLGPVQSAFCPALYGHGADVPSSPSYAFEDEVNRLALLLENRIGAGRTHIVGYSLGARLALALLLRAPALFHSATLVSGRRGLDSAEERQQRWLADLRWAERLRTLPFEKFLSEWQHQPLFASMQHLAPEKLSALRHERLKHDPLALADAMLALSLARMPSFRDELAAVAVPVSVLCGQLDGKFVGLGEELAARLPQGKKLVVHGVGHQLLIERPDAVATALREGLDHAQRHVEESQNL